MAAPLAGTHSTPASCKVNSMSHALPMPPTLAILHLKHSTPLIDDTSQAIKTGNGQSNILTIIAQGDIIDLYINKQFVNSVHDNSYTSGEIGVFAGNTGNITDAAFNWIRVWNL